MPKIVLNLGLKIEAKLVSKPQTSSKYRHLHKSSQKKNVLN